MLRVMSSAAIRGGVRRAGLRGARQQSVRNFGNFFGNSDKTKAEELRKQSDDFKEQWMRSHAESANCKREAEQDVANSLRKGRESLVQGLLGPLDDFTRVIEESEGQVGDDVREGLRLVRTQFLKALESGGVQEIQVAIGETLFDPDVHMAVDQVDSGENLPSETVVEVLQPGFTLNGNLLRPASVVVQA